MHTKNWVYSKMLWKAERKVNILMTYRAASSFTSEDVSDELAKLMQSPIDYSSDVFDEEFILFSKVNQEQVDISGLTDGTQCCAYFFNKATNSADRCRHMKKAYNRFCSGHFRELRSAQKRLKITLEPKAKLSQEVLDIYIFALQRLLIIKKFYRPGGPCEAQLSGHIRAILEGQTWQQVRQSVVQEPSVSHIPESTAFKDAVNISEPDEIQHEGTITLKTKSSEDMSIEDMLLGITRIIRTVPHFEPVEIEIPPWSNSMLTNIQYQKDEDNVMWRLYTCREISHFFDDKKPKHKCCNLYTHAVCFLVVELEFYILVVFFNRETRSMKTNTHGWVMMVPSISNPMIQSIVDGRVNAINLDASPDANKYVSINVFDIANLGSAFVFSKAVQHLDVLHDELTCALEAQSHANSSDRIVSRYLTEYQSGSQIKIKNSSQKQRKKEYDLGQAANRLPKKELIAQVAGQFSSDMIIGLDIELSGMHNPDIIRNWYPATEERRNLKAWTKIVEECEKNHGL